MNQRTGTTIDAPVSDLDTVEPNIGDYAVQAYNNDVTTFMDVVGVFIMSCGYDQATAERFALKIHNDKVALVFWGAKGRCEDVIKDFKAIGVRALLVGGSNGSGN